MSRRQRTRQAFLPAVGRLINLPLIEDALHPLGVKVDALPITPRQLRTLIREAQAAAA